MSNTIIYQCLFLINDLSWCLTLPDQYLGRVIVDILICSVFKMSSAKHRPFVQVSTTSAGRGVNDYYSSRRSVISVRLIHGKSYCGFSVPSSVLMSNDCLPINMQIMLETMDTSNASVHMLWPSDSTLEHISGPLLAVMACCLWTFVYFSSKSSYCSHLRAISFEIPIKWMATGIVLFSYIFLPCANTRHLFHFNIYSDLNMKWEWPFLTSIKILIMFQPNWIRELNSTI